ncbi:peptidoglycan bridge formation glycyltransferase FemA/FemB family protein [Ktedonosporobacter rubrisoli]|uniref:Peptidoglycan bridge formation glycyltransferase FemA/FemB family protein n=1 Tax=Ktedonosporobacter rubrisoli TaxID=2509675 RepID=A0A4P6JZ92_KTERU|nr:peptidoglycan bridge formation glycyltransferase FemA/FemB family protein [Ktedonosporobacter rubrisoli]QBD80915.1 peptidoglycan bridge formation glycyltransferase FemA/FemB family protein [Ktedonosporobacter rubrisoli]
MTISIKEISDQAQWNNFLTAQPRGHLLQSYEWGELNRYLGGNIYRLGALQDGRLVGALQLSVAPVPLPASVPGLRLNWLYGTRGPTVEGLDSPALKALIEQAHDIARQEHAVVLRLEPNIADDDPDLHKWLATYHRLGFRSNPIAIHGRRSWVLDIRPDAEQLLANFKMTWRQNVRASERKGVVIREANSEADFDTYYDLLKITSERDDFFIHSKDYNKEILRHFASKGDAVLYLAEHEGEAIAAKMLIRFGDWCWDMFGASSNHKRNLKPTYLLQYRCILWAKQKGCSYFDFRTIPEILEPGEEMWGVYEYKKGFGGFSRLNMPTQDYVYHPLIYQAWRKMVEIRRARRHKERQKIELERAERGKQSSTTK